MKDYTPGPLVPIAVESTQDGPTLVFVRHFQHPVTAVWAALTEPDQLDQWAPFTADVLRWELEAMDVGTRLTLRHTVRSQDSLCQVAAGWHICLDVAERLLAGRPVGVIRGQEALQYGWTELNDAYAEVMKDR